MVNPYGTTNSAAATLTVSPDLTKPTLTSVGNLGNAILLTLIFSEPVEAASATNAANYSISGGINVLSAAFIADTRTIILTTTPMAGQTVYILTVNNVRDRAVTPNTILPNTQKTFTLDSTPLDISFVKPSAEPPGPSSRRGPLVISEIMYHPATRADGKNLEFIEIFNSNPFSEDLGGFRLSGEVDFTFPSNTVLSARSYLVLAASPADLRSLYGISNLIGPYTNRLSNGSGTLRLRNRQGGIVFRRQLFRRPALAGGRRRRRPFAGAGAAFPGRAESAGLDRQRPVVGSSPVVEPTQRQSLPDRRHQRVSRAYRSAGFGLHRTLQLQFGGRWI